MPNLPAAVDPRILALLGEAPAEPFSPVFVESVQQVEEYGRQWALELAGELALDAHLRAPKSAGELVAALGLAARATAAIEWLLAELAAGGWLERQAPASGAATTYSAPHGLPAPRRSTVRAEILALDPGNAATLALLDVAGQAFTPVARGEKSGEPILLGPAGIGLWADYFRNDNPLYAINNTVAAAAAVNRLPADRPLRLLEVGAGGGSGTQALLAALAAAGRLADLGEYRVTEPSPFFRRRSQRELPAAWPGVSLSFGDLDIDRPWADQGVEAGAWDLVYGINVLHVARRLDASLAEARAALRPGGWLVAGECVRPFAGQPMAAEMVFLLLDGFTSVELAPERPNPGFLTPENWLALLAAAGFEAGQLVPDVGRIRTLTTTFLTAAVCARQPA